VPDSESSYLLLHHWLGRLRPRYARPGPEVREYDFVQAARALGASNMRILFTHIMPNAVQPLIVQASLGMAGAVISEASLSFLALEFHRRLRVGER
jgi:peptide/nickel transport system permease protein